MRAALWRAMDAGVPGFKARPRRRPNATCAPPFGGSTTTTTHITTCNPQNQQMNRFACSLQPSKLLGRPGPSPTGVPIPKAKYREQGDYFYRDRRVRACFPSFVLSLCVGGGGGKGVAHKQQGDCRGRAQV